MYRITKSVLVLLMVTSTSFAQDMPVKVVPTTPPPMVIDPADADAFREIIETTIPPRYNKALIQWYSNLLKKQQDKMATEASKLKE